jgi:uncharacterized DUF497 family protein
MSLVFEWDARKARSNLRKHRVSFSGAVSVFGNPLARIFPDKEHSAEELREIIVGHSPAKPLLPVCFMEAQVEKVRIILAKHI